MTTIGKVDTSDFIMVIRRATIAHDIFQSAKIEWAGLKHTNPYIVKQSSQVN